MIYLITGNMGTGKTSRAVNMILTNEDGLFKTTAEDGTPIDRPLYFCHIDGLDAAKFHAHELTKEEIQSAPLDEILPTGAVLIVDEAHWTYPVRSAAKAVPPYVQKLSELRHDGFTLILMTQHPSQLDIFVRNLVSKHIHLERKSVGMKQYWWYKCVTTLDNPAGLSGTESASWKPPKAAFKYYKSASKHQKFKKRVPLVVWAFAAILAFIGWKAWGVYGAYSGATGGSEAAAVAESASEPLATAAYGGNVPTAQEGFTAAQSQNLSPADFVPTLAEKPESKPIYNNVRQVRTFERVAGCIASGSSCNCYSDQGTQLAEISTELCISYTENGLPFNPYKEPERQAVTPIKAPES
ncbi:zonular occludens toxin domain-containing protein [Neisseria shayeganii]|uniref:Zonula occludens toxin family protein n=1 Tax=Neisseria shayeganii 871 TaxID=1032488 RepID=G4CLJ5_9NEIS|nr:zonular occludens toxin domain-containing protein [Neisseria shayeganii]EGY51314.1 zonula occludens toxin family protein [Neisseria shayeganii 871]